MNPTDILILPGWQNSGPGHWQTVWEERLGYHRVQQHDWQRPLRGDWNIQLEEAVLARPGPVLLVAHSLGCVLVAAWAAHSRNTQRVAGALLVAPPDLEREDLQPLLPSWTPIERRPLPFPSTLVASSNDPYAAESHAQALARAWGSQYVPAGPGGHLNAESKLGDWPAGQALLRALMPA
ncbi:alpha/beta fold hydrolase [Curvibacter sp. HBC28]|uniref:Alpha/beta fold hydrolase n=1 Tax=Curvibacter microcysteis TaxID=3026419 RepID=A0ABT5MBH4_9BURK|nr:alpha/beta fold hydrolase [Curvibacter sp. HBC28]MDD0813924.1 alpha/beta fold hydrolase [Curvibacter sp. HBC28]